MLIRCGWRCVHGNRAHPVNALYRACHHCASLHREELLTRPAKLYQNLARDFLAGYQWQTGGDPALLCAGTSPLRSSSTRELDHVRWPLPRRFRDQGGKPCHPWRVPCGALWVGNICAPPPSGNALGLSALFSYVAFAAMADWLASMRMRKHV
jgi:hypothetical protein